MQQNLSSTKSKIIAQKKNDLLKRSKYSQSVSFALHEQSGLHFVEVGRLRPEEVMHHRRELIYFGEAPTMNKVIHRAKRMADGAMSWVHDGCKYLSSPLPSFFFSNV